MMKLRFVYNVFCVPALVIHELMHIISAFLVGSTVSGIEIIKHDNFSKDFSLRVEIYAYSRFSIQNFITALSPIFAIFIPIVLFGFGFGVSAIILAVYQLLALKVVLPSKGDIDMIRSYRTDDELVDIMEKSLID